MKSRFVFAAFIIVLACLVPSCGLRTSNADKVNDAGKTDFGDLGEGAILKFDTLHHSFGVLQSGEEVACRFAFTNTGTAPLLIRDVRVGCGCTNVKYPQQPVKPGDSGSVELTFNTRGKNGLQNQKVVVLSNAEETSIILSITAQVEQVVN